ncbi:hypothetical protein BG015_005054, partial [Linnemannia schmuckeri]
IVPHCIKHHPGIVLDVILTTGANQVHEDSPMATSRLMPTDGRAETPIHAPIDPYHLGTIVDELNVSHPASSTGTPESVSGLAIAAEPLADLSSAEPHQATVTRGNTTHFQNQFISLAAFIEHARQSGKPLTSEVLSSLITSKLTLTSMTKSEFERTVIHKLDGLNEQGAMTQRIVREVLELQKQMNDRLILVQSKTEAILTQQLELAEYPIPRLFIVLPEEPAKYDPTNWFRTKFRLHFICECGRHTEANNSKVPHHLHLAKHEGYLVREPTKFFKKYGPFLLLMLELIKFGTSIVGHVVPILASLKVVELADSVKQPVELVTARIDYSLKCIDNQLAKAQASSPEDFIGTEPDAAMTQQDLINYLRDVEGLEGVELRQLGSFLKTSEEENLLGNLYRMTTSEGHVKWVCRDHYRASYLEKHAQKLRDVVRLAQGEFDEQLGRIEIVLRSRSTAAEFYNVFRKAKGVLELIVDLRWECTRRDLEELQDALKGSEVLILWLDLQRFQISLSSKLFLTSTQHKVLFPITKLPNMKVIHIVLPKTFFMLYSLPPKHSSHLHKLSFEMVLGWSSGRECRILIETLKPDSTPIWYLYYNPIGCKGAVALAETLQTNPTLATWDLKYNSIESDGAVVLAEVLKTNSTLTTLDLYDNLIRSDGAKALAKALKANSALTTLDLYDNSIGSDGAKALAEALKANSALTTLHLGGNSIGSDGAKALAEALKTNSILATLNLQYNSIGFDGAKELAEALKTNSIGSNAAVALAEALKTNSALTILYLGGNSIGSDEAKALADALKINSTLTTLDLYDNSIGSDGAKALAEALKANSALTTLNLEGNSIGSNGAKALSKAL